MCSSHRPRIVYTVGLSTTERCISVHLVIEDFGLVGSPQHCWEDLVVDRLLVVGCFLDSLLDCFWLALVGY